MNTDFTKVFEEAEKQVAAIKSEKLREIAFEKLISYLLEGDTPNRVKNSASNFTGKKVSRSIVKEGKTRTDGPKAWIKELVDEGFFANPKSSAQIREELETRSHHLSSTDITRPLETLCHGKLLRRKKITSDGGKEVLHWVKW